jgi:hypothetical protein
MVIQRTLTIIHVRRPSIRMIILALKEPTMVPNTPLPETLHAQHVTLEDFALLLVLNNLVAHVKLDFTVHPDLHSLNLLDSLTHSSLI